MLKYIIPFLIAGCYLPGSQLDADTEVACLPTPCDGKFKLLDKSAEPVISEAMCSTNAWLGRWVYSLQEDASCTIVLDTNCSTGGRYSLAERQINLCLNPGDEWAWKSIVTHELLHSVNMGHVEQGISVMSPIIVPGAGFTELDRAECLRVGQCGCK